MRHVYPTVEVRRWMALYALKSCTAPVRLRTEHIQRTQRMRWVRGHTIRGHRGRLPVGVNYTVCDTPWTPGHTVTRAPSWTDSICFVLFNSQCGTLCLSLRVNETDTFDRHLKSHLEPSGPRLFGSSHLLPGFGRKRIFTALHGMQRGLTMRFLSVCPSVRPPVCLSVCQTRALWQNGRKLYV